MWVKYMALELKNISKTLLYFNNSKCSQKGCWLYYQRKSVRQNLNEYLIKLLITGSLFLYRWPGKYLQIKFSDKNPSLILFPYTSKRYKFMFGRYITNNIVALFKKKRKEKKNTDLKASSAEQACLMYLAIIQSLEIFCMPFRSFKNMQRFWSLVFKLQLVFLGI